jgi:hypothetical protein
MKRRPAVIAGSAPKVSEIGRALNRADYASLATRWIDAPLAKAARIRRVDTVAGRDLVGRRDYRQYGGLAIPYFFQGEPQVRAWRLRRDHPEIEVKDGREREVAKYMSCSGSANRVYFPPGITANVLKNVAIPVILTEGEFKTLSLSRLSNEGASAPRFLPLGVSGVWNWRGKIGEQTGPNGQRVVVKGVIPDLNLIEWNGHRRVIIAFDADAGTNANVQAAKNHLAR